MSRATLAVDRVLGALAALLLIGASLFGIAWWSGRLGFLPQRLDLAGLGWLPRQAWWPWALGVVAVLLVLAGLRWLAGHLPDRGVTHLFLTGSSAEGKLIVSARPVASASACATEARYRPGWPPVALRRSSRLIVDGGRPSRRAISRTLTRPCKTATSSRSAIDK